MAFVISSELLQKVQLSSEEVRVDFACYLFEKGRLSLSKARALSGLDAVRFQEALGQRGITMPHRPEDFDEELKNLGLLP